MIDSFWNLCLYLFASVLGRENEEKWPNRRSFFDWIEASEYEQVLQRRHSVSAQCLFEAGFLFSLFPRIDIEKGLV